MPYAGVSRGTIRRRRAAVIKRDGLSCHWCGITCTNPKAGGAPVPATPDQATLDHIRTRAEGGQHDMENLVLACRRCNEKRGKLAELRALQAAE